MIGELRNIYLLLIFALVASCKPAELEISYANKSEDTTTKVETLEIYSDISGGSFKTSPSVKLSLSSTSSPQIWSCSSLVNSEDDQLCCDPLSEGTLSSTQEVSVNLVNSGDGLYCLSYKGFASNGLSTDVKRSFINIDATLPDLNISTDVVQLQSTKLFSLGVNSTNLGDANFDFRAMAFSAKQTDTCGIIAASNFVTNGISFDGDTTEDVLNFGTYTAPNESFSLLGRDLKSMTGDVHVYGVLEDTVSGNSACTSFIVHVKDFTILGFSTGGDVAPSVDDNFEFIGTFDSHFGGIINGNTLTTNLSHGIENIIY